MMRDACAITLAAKAPDELVLIGKVAGDAYRVARGSDTWTLAADDRHVTLHGDLCAYARAGTLQKLRFASGCEDLAAWPPDFDDAGM